MHWTSHAESHTGNKRKNNQDAYYTHDKNGLWVIADGMGGYEAGEITSQTITQSLANLAQTGQANTDILTVTSILEDVNEQLVAQNTANNRIVGSTVAAAFMEQDTCTCLWAGDSRIYLFRDSNLVQLSLDHSYVEELIQNGEIDRADADKHSKSNVITRAIGVAESLTFDYKEIELLPGDRLLLCSDGLYGEISPSEIATILEFNPEPKKAVTQLLDLTLSREAKDNVNIIIVGESE
jgi:serine/threonine protein phosphatase PrpC